MNKHIAKKKYIWETSVIIRLWYSWHASIIISAYNAIYDWLILIHKKNVTNKSHFQLICAIESVHFSFLTTETLEEEGDDTTLFTVINKRSLFPNSGVMDSVG